MIFSILNRSTTGFEFLFARFKLSNRSTIVRRKPFYRMDLEIESGIAGLPLSILFPRSTAAALTWLIQFHESGSWTGRAEAVSPDFFYLLWYQLFTAAPPGSLAGGMTLALACWRGGR
jgi:hypothetical protein